MNEKYIASQLLEKGQHGNMHALLDCFEVVRNIEQNDMTIVESIKGENPIKVFNKENFNFAHNYAKTLRRLSAKAVLAGGGAKMLNLNKRCLLFDAPYEFDAAIRYAEYDREPRKRFYEPRRKQLLPIVKQLQRLEDGDLEILGISLPPGVGKALANDTPILTRQGWKNHGDLVVGDEVIGIDGEFKKVIAVHPKCSLDILVEFTNGEKIQCHENHEWQYFDRRCGEYKTTEIKEIEKVKLDIGVPEKRGHRYLFLLPPKKHIKGKTQKLFDPYTFGAWLGDGTNTDPRISNPISDYAIIDKIVSNGNKIAWHTVNKITGVHDYGFSFRKELQKYGLCNSRKHIEKYIPEIYLIASIKQRLELLAGLLDTDGTMVKNGKYIFSTTSEQLKNGFIELISTFGWRACVTVQSPRISSSGIVGKKPCYNIGFTPDLEIPCVLERKQNKLGKKQRRIAIKNITRVAPKEGNCITVEGDGMYLAGHTMLPTHNTTLAEMFIVWQALKHPELSNLGGSHSNSILSGIYNEISRMTENNGEYHWRDIFPEINWRNTNANNMRIDFGSPKRFETIQFSSIGSGNAGKVRASNLLYCDDLISDIEIAMNRDRLEKIYSQYTTDLRQRKIGNCKELHIATRWSVHDVIGKLQSAYEGNPKAKFITLSALNENDESNFDYPYSLGFTTEFYHEQRDIMDDVSWKALYMNEPIEREGLLYQKDELRRYFELPDAEPDAILSVCDTKTTGADYCVMLVAYQYGTEYFIDDCVCENYAPDLVEVSLVNFLLKHNPHLCQFESNVAGGRLSQAIQEKIKAKGSRTKITSRWTQANKETKILANSPWVKEHCIFKDDSTIKGGKHKEYRLMLEQLTTYTLAGKNKHDDVPDAFAQLAIFAQGAMSNRVIIRDRFF